MLRKSDKNNVFQFPVPPTFRGLKGYYSDVIKSPMDLGTVSMQIDSKYRWGMFRSGSRFGKYLLLLEFDFVDMSVVFIVVALLVLFALLFSLLFVS